jgi:hypothetical protein
MTRIGSVLATSNCDESIKRWFARNTLLFAFLLHTQYRSSVQLGFRMRLAR